MFDAFLESWPKYFYHLQVFKMSLDEYSLEMIVCLMLQLDLPSLRNPLYSLHEEILFK